MPAIIMDKSNRNKIIDSTINGSVEIKNSDDNLFLNSPIGKIKKESLWKTIILTIITPIAVGLILFYIFGIG